MGNKAGGNTGTVTYSPQRAARKRKQRQAQERRWAAMAGPVTVRQAQPKGIAASGQQQ
jgi:hypothetical protein